jgi:hypothetical protein
MSPGWNNSVPNSRTPAGSAVFANSGIASGIGLPGGLGLPLDGSDFSSRVASGWVAGTPVDLLQPIGVARRVVIPDSGDGVSQGVDMGLHWGGEGRLLEFLGRGGNSVRVGTSKADARDGILSHGSPVEIWGNLHSVRSMLGDRHDNTAPLIDGLEAQAQDENIALGLNGAKYYQ